MLATRLLIVEDSELTAGALRLLFEQLGHEVNVARDVRTAILSVLDVKPDLMLLDLTLPDGDGLDVLSMLQDQNQMPGRTIAVTGHDDPELRARCILAGCSEVLLKPVPIAQLRALVQST